MPPAAACASIFRADTDNCGACGNHCPDPAGGGAARCTAGKCQLSCNAAARALRESVHRYATSDPANCRACGDCQPRRGSCARRAFAKRAAPPASAIAAALVSTLQARVSHCGGCDVTCPSPVHGAATARPPTCDFSCTAGFEKCGSSCVDTEQNAKNCGACGKVCDAPANGVAVCSAGACDFGCNVGYAKCGSACVKTDTDPRNCGACGTTCGPNQVCAASKCSSSCPSGALNCTSACVNPQSDASNCGACGTMCNAAPHASAVCTTLRAAA